MRIYDSVLDLIGNTPLVRINHITKQQKIKAQVLAKMESLNPGYSVKDRIGISMSVSTTTRGFGAENTGRAAKAMPNAKAPVTVTNCQRRRQG